jgi:Tol biopolymer transport system component
MTLRAGDRLGPYEILGGLGAGGMGEVYRARDPRLGRAVAIKVLPPEADRDLDRLRRFEQEARASGTLSHPNIMVVHDVGADADGSPYLVSELLDGETLRQRLQGGALPARKAIEVAKQVARGLAAAHERGIVHRDLKPENLFLTKDGIAKILDFGLAGLERPAEPPADDKTATVLTAPGVVMGTAGYMSPEQACGRPADHRSDIFALGAVLYEMLAGRRAFRGETFAETLDAILRQEPPELSPATPVPQAVERVVRHCLEKDPADRFQSARDLVFELEGLGEATGTARGSAQAGKTGARGRWWRTTALLALLVAAALASGIVFGRRTASGGLKFQPLTFRRGTVWNARFSADRRTVVYGATWEGQPIRLFTTRPGSTESRPLDLPDADVLAISRSDELALALNRDRFSYVGTSSGTLARAFLGGGSPKPLLENVAGADWSADGKDLAIVRGDPDGSRLEYPIGTVLVRNPRPIRFPRVSPGGDLVAFYEFGEGGVGNVAVVGRGGETRRLTPTSKRGPNSLVWSPKGDEVWFGCSFRGDEWAIYAADLRGRLRVVTELPFVGHIQDLLPDGRALLTMHYDRGETMARPPGGTEEKNVSWLDWPYALDLSADGRQLLFWEFGSGGARSYAVYLRPTDGSVPAVLVGDTVDDGGWAGFSAHPRWLLLMRASIPPELQLVPTGPGESKSIRPTGVELQRAPAPVNRDHFVLADGHRVVFCGHEAGRPARSWLQDVGGGRPRPITPEGQVVEAVSPDGSLALGRNAEGRLVLYPVDGGESRLAPGPPETGSIKAWSADGRSLFVTERETSGGLATRIFRRDLASGQRALLKELRPPDQTGLVYVRAVVSADGGAYAYSLARCLSSLYLVEGLK